MDRKELDLKDRSKIPVKRISDVHLIQVLLVCRNFPIVANVIKRTKGKGYK